MYNQSSAKIPRPLPAGKTTPLCRGSGRNPRRDRYFMDRCSGYAGFLPAQCATISLLAIFRAKHTSVVVARKVSLDADGLPYRPTSCATCVNKGSGTKLVLSPRRIIHRHAVAVHLSGLFDEVLATTEGRNLHGPRKQC